MGVSLNYGYHVWGPIMRIIVFWSLFWGPHILGNYPLDISRFRHIQGCITPRMELQGSRQRIRINNDQRTFACSLLHYDRPQYRIFFLPGRWRTAHKMKDRVAGSGGEKSRHCCWHSSCQMFFNPKLITYHRA